MGMKMVSLETYIYGRLEQEAVHKIEKIGIYGTGVGAEMLYDALKKLSADHCLTAVIDRDDAASIGKEKFGKKVRALDAVLTDVDLILVGAKIHHEAVFQRISAYIRDAGADIRVLDPFCHVNSVRDKLEYLEFLEARSKRCAPAFVPLSEDEFHRTEEDTKLIAWYLPQYYEIDVNNRYYGRGFTEWTNSSRTLPQFTGHYQPHIPYDVGYYNLTRVDTLKRQVYLAQKYGIYGFCFHYYWFSGKRLMEKPLELFLAHPEIDMPFCINWANENWTCKWDGGNQDIIFEQKLRPEDDVHFMSNILPVLKDKRYITIDGKPVLIIYRNDIFERERFQTLLLHFREFAAKNGLPGLYIMITTASKCKEDVGLWGADALVEFPPHGTERYVRQVVPEGYLNPNFKGWICDMASAIEKKAYFTEYESKKVMRGIMTSYDNTARRGLTAAGIYYGIEPRLYKEWLKALMAESRETHRKEENFVFINAWNEWAEGAHLEPDLEYGYAYLQATMEALCEVRI